MISDLENEILGNFAIQNAVNFAMIQYLVEKGIIDLEEYQAFMKEREFNLRKGLSPEVTERYSKNIKDAFDYASFNVEHED